MKTPIEVRRKEWFVVGAVATLALFGVAAPANAANKAISVLLSVNGTNCSAPQGQTYGAEGVAINSSGDAVCTAYSAGATAWQYCNHAAPCAIDQALVTNQAFMLSFDSATMTASSLLCSSTAAWGTATACNYVSGSCTWTAYAQGKN